jgi:serine/threonine protein kinase/tetratricopeptide (TPR) repeat protein
MSLAVADPAHFAGTSRFEVLRVLGQGGVGVVYEALDRELNERVALKTLRVVSPEALLRFKQEFRTLQDLDHPNLVRLGELIEEAGTWFFTMELVQGIDLLSFVRLRSSERHASDETSAAAPGPSSASLRGPSSSTPNPAFPTYVAPTPELTPDAPGGAPAARGEAAPAADATSPGAGKRVSSPADHVTSDTLGSGAPPAAPELPAQPGPRLFSETRVRHAFTQLAEGLEALHRAQLVHRDVKPSNVLVTDDGRVVILDFGLITEVAEVAEEGVMGMGTLAFMAPEQWRGAVPQPASDLYAVGVALYLALTGALPFGGKSRQELAWRKLNTDPPPPHAFCAELPADLEALCLELLRLDPAARPTGAELARRLGEAKPGARAPAKRSKTSSTFLGRQAELSELAHAFDQSRKGGTVCVLVTGDSGIGKSTLVRHFRDAVMVAHPDTLVLAGRCHERESVPYKAIDGVVDALSRRLRRLPDDEVAALLPEWTGALSQVFPVLRQVEAIARLAGTAPLLERTELHRRVFATLRELFARVGERWPLLVLIDDLQWADPDSLALLAELLRPPGPRLLLVATQRGPAASAVRLGDVELRRIHVSALPAAESIQLAMRWLGEAGAARPELADALAREGAGHPLFIAELAQHLAEGEDAAASAAASAIVPAQVRFDDALRQRIARLDEPARRLLELVAVAGVPLPQAFFAEVAGLPFADFARHAATLRAGRLLRTSGPRPSNRAEPYHDRISESLRAGMTAEVARDWHERLARALEPLPSSAPELLSVHWEGAGDLRRAADFAVRAGDEAIRAVAFERAARMYRRALELVGRMATPADTRELGRLEFALADALVNAGRSRDAAEIYLRAAARAPAGEALDLRRRASEAYLVSGRVDEGMTTIAGLLEEVGMPLPASRAATLLSIGLSRAQLKLRGLECKIVEEADVEPELLLKMDVAWSAGMGLAFVDVIQSTWFQQRFLLLSLRTGERRRFIRGLVCEAVLIAAGGSRTQARTAALLARLEALGATVDRAYDRGWIACTSALCAYLEGRFTRVMEFAEGALPYLERAGYSSSWEVDTMRVMLITCQFMTGRTRDMVERSDEYMRAARDRGDHYEATLLRTAIPNHVWLVRNDPETARRMANDAIAGWSKRGTIVHTFMDVMAQTGIDLYEAPASDAAWQRVTGRWKSLVSAYMLAYQVGLVQCTELRGRAAVAASRRAPLSRARTLWRAAEKDAAAIAREGPPPAAPFAAMIRASVRHQQGRADDAIRLVREAVLGFDRADMALHAQAARRQLGTLVGGDEGKALVAAADAWMSAQAIVDPARLTAMLAPGLGPAVD